MTGTASIRAVSDGLELRQGKHTIHLYAHQLMPFADYAVGWAEQLEQRKESSE